MDSIIACTNYSLWDTRMDHGFKYQPILIYIGKSYRILTYRYDTNPIILPNTWVDITNIADIDGRYCQYLIVKFIDWYRDFNPWNEY